MRERLVPRRARRPKRVNDPKGLRERLLDVAASSFQSRGYGATRMHDIIHDADTTGGATYHHFPTKKALAIAVLRERVAQEVEETWLGPIRSATSVADGVRSIFERIGDQLDARGSVSGCPLNNLALELSLADPDFRAAIQEVFDRWRATIAGQIRAEQFAGAFAGVDADALAMFIVASYSGAMALAKANQSATPLRSCAQQLAQFMMP